MESKQAIVLIHGIGEQVPMETLRGFVESVWTQDENVHGKGDARARTWSKPDEISGDFELRRLTTSSNKDGKRTDFFEFYWAHLMAGTTLSHLGAWAKVLLLRRPSRVPKQLRGIWWSLFAILMIGIAAGINQAFQFVPVPAWFIKVGAVVWFVAGSTLLGLLIHVAGDAARYLHVAPPNIEIRRRIREAGISLLQKLHESRFPHSTVREYDRIVVVGHSLGSVIGYDILTHLWVRYHDQDERQRNAPAASSAKLQALESIARGSPIDVDQYQAVQSEYLGELRAQGCGWRVTDFVTLGSPLSHAFVLMARDKTQFEAKVADREFPTCPPEFEVVEGSKRFSFKKDDRWVPHHAAVFAPTRWTNLYFPCHATLWGDVIGGPMDAFGKGIRDVRVATTLRRGLLSHTLYWTMPTKGQLASWIDELRRAVRISEPSPASAEGGEGASTEKKA